METISVRFIEINSSLIVRNRAANDFVCFPCKNLRISVEVEVAFANSNSLVLLTRAVIDFETRRKNQITRNHFRQIDAWADQLNIIAEKWKFAFHSPSLRLNYDTETSIEEHLSNETINVWHWISLQRTMLRNKNRKSSQFARHPHPCSELMKTLIKRNFCFSPQAQ